MKRLLVLGAGFTGGAVARLARERGVEVVASTRDAGRAERLRALGCAPLLAPDLASAELPIDGATAVLVAFPPDGRTDAALVPRLSRARAVAYVSSSVVYGRARGRVDERTRVAADTPRGVARVEAEALHRSIGATVVRAPAIYGPGRGIHTRLAAGTLKLHGDGTNVVSRVHVDDLASALYELLAGDVRGATFVAGDRVPAPHVEVIRFVADALSLPMPPRAPAESADETLRNERALDPSLLWSTLGREPRFPSYREGYLQCIAADRLR
jgi:nucleoside-diphosphate-sugar epimerase